MTDNQSKDPKNRGASLQTGRYLDERIAAGEVAPLREWLREHVHRHGSKWGARELLEGVTGSPISVRPFVSYLKRKLSDVYRVDLSE